MKKHSILLPQYIQEDAEFFHNLIQEVTGEIHIDVKHNNTSGLLEILYDYQQNGEDGSVAVFKKLEDIDIESIEQFIEHLELRRITKEGVFEKIVKYVRKIFR